MSRAVITYEHPKSAMPGLADRADRTKRPEDEYKDRLLKYIPAEVVTLYLGLTAIIATRTEAPAWLGWAIFGACLVATPFYLIVTLKVRNWIQLSISTVAFMVWVFAINSKLFGVSDPVYGGVLLPIFTFFVAAIPTTPQPPPTGNAGQG